MNTQEVIGKLTEHDRLIVRDMLAGVYSIRYVNAMFANTRKRSDLFKRTVKMYWEHRETLRKQFEGTYITNVKEAEV